MTKLPSVCICREQPPLVAVSGLLHVVAKTPAWLRQVEKSELGWAVTLDGVIVGTLDGTIDGVIEGTLDGTLDGVIVGTLDGA